jgi:hypothetical protein
MKEEHKYNKMLRKNVNITKCKWRMQRCNKSKKKVEPKLKLKPFVLSKKG